MAGTLQRIVALAREKLIPGDSVRDKAVVGSAWLGAIRTFGRGLHMIKLAVLARLLTPGDFGLMGIALLALATLEQFSRLGLDTALIQRAEENVDHYLDTMLVLKIARGTLIAVLLFFGAPYIAAFFGEPRVTGLLQVLAVLPVLRAFNNPGIVYFSKDLQFHKTFAWDTSGNIINFVASVGFALVWPSVWALVFGNVVEDTFKLGMSYFLTEYWPGLKFDLAKARELFAYGKWVTGGAALLLVLNQGDDAFVGWFLGATALGYYQYAFRFGNAPATEISTVISSALLPTFSKVQEDQEQLTSAFEKSLKLITLVSFPAAVGVLVVAPAFVPVVLGQNWLPIVPALQILAVWGLIRSVNPIFGKLFEAVGRPDINTKINGARLILLAAVIFPATARYGMEGTAVAVTTTAACSVLVSAYLAVQYVEWSYRRLFLEFSYQSLSSILMGLTVFQLWVFGLVDANLLGLLLMIATGIIAYGVFTAAVARLTAYDPWSPIGDVVKTFT